MISIDDRSMKVRIRIEPTELNSCSIGLCFCSIVLESCSILLFLYSVGLCWTCQKKTNIHRSNALLCTLVFRVFLHERVRCNDRNPIIKCSRNACGSRGLENISILTSLCDYAMIWTGTNKMMCFVCSFEKMIMMLDMLIIEYI